MRLCAERLWEIKGATDDVPEVSTSLAGGIEGEGTMSLVLILIFPPTDVNLHALLGSTVKFLCTKDK